MWGNGTCLTTGFQYKVETTKNTSDTWNFILADNEVYPGNYVYPNETYMEAQTHSAYNINNKVKVIKVEVNNISNTVQNSFLELMIDIHIGIALVEVCNSSYTTGNLDTTPYCTEIASLDTTTVANHTHTTNSNHTVISMGLNITDGLVNNVKVTEDMYVLVRALATPVDIDVYYIADITRTDQVQNSNSKGIVYNNFVGTPDLHIHQFNSSQYFIYFAGACTVFNGCANSTNQTDLLQLRGLAPNTPDVSSPTDTTYAVTDIVDVNFSQYTSPNALEFNILNITLWNSDVTFNVTINWSDIPFTTYDWGTTGYDEGIYFVGVQYTDNESQQSTIGYSINFTLGTTTTTTTLRPLNATYPGPLLKLIEGEPLQAAEEVYTDIMGDFFWAAILLIIFVSVWLRTNNIFYPTLVLDILWVVFGADTHAKVQMVVYGINALAIGLLIMKTLSPVHSK